MRKIIALNFAKARKASVDLTETANASLKEKGVKVIDLSPGELAKFKATQKQVWKHFEPEIGKDWLDKVIAFSDKFGAGK